MTTLQQDLSEERECIGLASAVVRRAFVDLKGTQERYAALHRYDAYNFLTVRMWELDNLWGGLLAHILVKHRVLRIVHQICPIQPEKPVHP